MENTGGIPGPGEAQSLCPAWVSVFMLRCLKANTQTLRPWVWMLAGADHSQTKLLSFSHLTTNYTGLILSTQFERTMITLCLIFSLNILPKTGRLWAVQGRQQACTVWQRSCRGAGWMLHPQAWTTASGRSGEGVHLGSTPIQTSAASKSDLREVKENSRPQSFWFHRNIQSCALKVVPWHGWSTFSPKI